MSVVRTNVAPARTSRIGREGKGSRPCLKTRFPSRTIARTIFAMVSEDRLRSRQLPWPAASPSMLCKTHRWQHRAFGHHRDRRPTNRSRSIRRWSPGLGLASSGERHFAERVLVPGRLHLFDLGQHGGPKRCALVILDEQGPVQEIQDDPVRFIRIVEEDRACEAVGIVYAIIEHVWPHTVMRTGVIIAPYSFSFCKG